MLSSKEWILRWLHNHSGAVNPKVFPPGQSLPLLFSTPARPQTLSHSLLCERPSPQWLSVWLSLQVSSLLFLLQLLVFSSSSLPTSPCSAFRPPVKSVFILPHTSNTTPSQLSMGGRVILLRWRGMLKLGAYVLFLKTPLLLILICFSFPAQVKILASPPPLPSLGRTDPEAWTKL